MLEYIFKDGDKIVYEGKDNFIRNDKRIEFFCGHDNIIIEINRDEVLFLKMNDESIFKILKTKKGNYARLYLLDKKLEFDLNIIFLEILNDNNYICFKYILESDEKTLKSLEIRY